jgi:hypothetical protein
MPGGHVVAMKDAEFRWLASSDPRLVAYAASRLPAWLWTADGTRILWANAAGVRLFGAASVRSLSEKTFGPADRTGGRSRGSRAGCSRAAPSGWSACRDLARRPAGL